MPAVPPPKGVYVPAVLFFKQNEDLDYDGKFIASHRITAYSIAFLATKQHVLRLAKGQVTGILVQGSNGEAQHLSHEERKAAIRFTRQTLDQNGFEKVVIIAGTGAQSTRETIQLCKDAQEAGAAFALVLTPSTWVPAMTRENVLRFHQTVHWYTLPVANPELIQSDFSGCGQLSDTNNGLQLPHRDGRPKPNFRYHWGTSQTSKYRWHKAIVWGYRQAHSAHEFVSSKRRRSTTIG